jgi:uncharacterized protein YaiL (DUF2058 family)
MQSLRDKLLEAGLVTREQADRAAASGKKGGKRPGGERGGDRGPPRDAAPAGEARGPRPQGRKVPERPVRMLDLSDPSRLGVLQAIETHRVREETLGEEQFFFTLRDGRVRRLFVSPATVARLEAGSLAIVENGEPEKHVLVEAGAVDPIRALDPEAVRFHNGA